MTLERRAWLSLVVLAVVMGALLFVPAGTLRFWHAWIYLALFHGLSAVITRDLMRRDRALLARRMKGGRPRSRVRCGASSCSALRSGSSDC